MGDESLHSVPNQEGGSSSVSAQKLLLQAKMCVIFALEDRQNTLGLFLLPLLCIKPSY